MTDSSAKAPLETTMGQPTTKATASPSAVSSEAITALSVVKIAVGATSLVAPELAGRLFSLDIPPQAAIVARLFGSSHLALGALTWDLHRRGSADLSRVVVVNVVADVIDTVSSSIAFAAGMYGTGTYAWLGGGAVAAAALGLLGFRGL